jgi:hypothetical protein
MNESKEDTPPTAADLPELRASGLPTLAQIKPRRRPEFLRRLDELHRALP